MPGAVFGLAATSLRGCTGSALDPADGQLIAQMMRMLIHDRHRTSWSNKISLIGPIKLSNDTLSFLL
jgi:hypothetical protein